VGNVINVEGPAGGGVMMYAGGEYLVGIGGDLIRLVHSIQPWPVVVLACENMF
jgi:hypothetical protein